MEVISKKLLLEAGVHFGHNTRRWNPKMKEYIFEARNNIYIIDLAKTEQCVNDAYQKLFTIAQNGGKILFVGTRKQVQEIIKEEAVRSEMYYVDHRWLGGTLTNFVTIRKSIKKLFAIEKMEEDGTFEALPKKEVLLLKRNKEKLNRFFSGIRDMTKLPAAMFVVDPKTEHNAVAEARKLKIPVFGLVDTNCDPDDVDFVIPGNDDAPRSVKLIVATMANAIVEANGGTPIEITFPDEPEEQFPRRNNRGGRNYRDRRPRRNRENKPYRAYRPKPQTEKKKEEEVKNSTVVENKEQTKKVEAIKEAAPKKEAKKVEAKKEAAPKKEVKKVEAKKEAAPKKEVKKVEAKKETAPKKEVKKAAAKKVTAKKEVLEYHVMYRLKDKKWIVKTATGTRALRVFALKAEAKEYATATAQSKNGVVVSHTKSEAE